jgi:hypothetical protein
MPAINDRQTTCWLPKAPSEEGFSGVCAKTASAFSKWRLAVGQPVSVSLNNTAPAAYARDRGWHRVSHQAHVLLGDGARVLEFGAAVVHVEQAEQHVHARNKSPPSATSWSARL